MTDPKEQLVEALGQLNEAVLGKLDGLGQYDLRRPLTHLGIVREQVDGALGRHQGGRPVRAASPAAAPAAGVRRRAGEGRG